MQNRVFTQAEIEAEMQRLKLEDLALQLAQLKAENANLKAENARLRVESARQKRAPKPSAEPAAEVMLPTDIRLGVIDPKHLTKRDKALLDILAEERTKLDKLKDKNDISGTSAKRIYSFFSQLGCSRAFVNEGLDDALARNVISKSPDKGKSKVVLFDAQWRPNLKQNE
jgi:hypothetical protein